MTSILAIVTTTVVGLMVGVEFAGAFVINRILLRLPLDASMSGRAHGGRMLGRVMPFWYIGSLILTGAIATFTWGTEASAVALVAAALLAISVIMSIAWLVPINNRSITWTPENHPDDWRQQQQRWDRLHYFRVAILIAAFVLVATSSTLSSAH
jgi:hypothetical protein